MDSNNGSGKQESLNSCNREVRIVKKTGDNFQFPATVTPDEFLPAISRWENWGGIVLVITFGALLALSTVLKYKVTVKVPATIRPTGELRLVQTLREGKVKRIAVRENQLVQEGEVIAAMDDSRLQTKRSQLQASIQRNQEQLEQINAQILALALQSEAETEQLNSALFSAKAELSLKQRNYRQRLITTVAEVEEAKAALELARDEATRYRQLVKSGAVSILQLKEKEAALKTAVSRLKRMQAYLDPSKAEVAIAQEQIVRERARGHATLAVLNKEREQLIQRRLQIRNQIERARRELQQIEIDIEAAVLRAPTSGTIQKLMLRNTSQVVSTGDTIAQIAPSHAPLEIKAAVAPQDISKIAIGQEVQMRVSACPYPEYGTLKGAVTTISADAIGQQKSVPGLSASSTLNQGIPKPSSQGGAYEVTIQPETLMLTAGKRQCPIQSGMEGRVDIISREETVFSFMLRKARLIVDL